MAAFGRKSIGEKNELIIAPERGLKNYGYVERLKKRMREWNVRQGCLYKKNG